MTLHANNEWLGDALFRMQAFELINSSDTLAVSYTHLDVYKRQKLRCEMKRLPDVMPEVKATSLVYHGALLGAAALVLKVQQTERGG